MALPDSCRQQFFLSDYPIKFLPLHPLFVPSVRCGIRDTITIKKIIRQTHGKMAENNRYLHHRCYRAISNIGMFGCLFRYKRFHVAHPDVLCNQSQSSLLRDYSMGLGTDMLTDHHAFYFLVERKKEQEELVSIIICCKKWLMQYYKFTAIQNCLLM